MEGSSSHSLSRYGREERRLGAQHWFEGQGGTQGRWGGDNTRTPHPPPPRHGEKMFMRSNSGNWKVPKMRCQLAAKYVASKPVALPEMPQKTQFDAQTLSIIESAEVENKVLGKIVEDDAKAFHDDMCAIVLEQGWTKEFEAERRK